MKKTVWMGMILLLGWIGRAEAQDTGLQESVRRILFLGNSITYAGQYVTFVDSWLALHEAGRQIECLNLGLPSETVSGLSEPNHADGKFPRPDLHERLARVLEAIHPDLVVACYGMNDGIYQPFDEERFKRFREGIEWLHGQVVATGAKIIHVTPPVYDERKGAAYANVLDLYSDWLLSKRYTDGWEVIDVHGPMKHYLEERRKSDAAYFLASDGVHPGETGHLLMAKAILAHWGVTGLEAVTDGQGLMGGTADGAEILRLKTQWQSVMKDGWLTYTGHQRPGMKKGLPIEEAKARGREIAEQIRQILHK
ncbi:MAG: SGNH/GDSL hydrolase family protein [Marinilabiliales bacterium]|nr:SGNH/GDSL hydrolase family protein [Marinilabiliales bacterium]